MLHIKAHYDWNKRHARYDGFGWRCIETDKPILFERLERVVECLPYEHSKNAKDGNVVTVAHMFCSGCQPIWNKSEIDKPLHFSELIDIRMPFEK